jgi:exopolyphosphatase/pppGpp-phosphohydrolase
MKKALLSLSLLLSSTLSAETVARVAIDWGSGSIKTQMHLVDTESNQLVGQPLLLYITPLALTEDVENHGGAVSPEMQAIALEHLKAMQYSAEIASPFYEIQYSGIATAAFRRASNGLELLAQINQQLGIPFRILSQQEEGQLGFLAAQALFPQIPTDQLLAWDSGNGSFQFAGSDGLFEGPLGYGTVRIILARDVKQIPAYRPDETGNPINAQEAQQLTDIIESLLPPPSDWLQQKLTAPGTTIVTWGDPGCHFGLTANAANGGHPLFEATLTRADFQQLIDTYMGYEDAQFVRLGISRRTLSVALYMATVMDHYGIDQFLFRPSMGNTAGMLIAPEYWP